LIITARCFPQRLGQSVAAFAIVDVPNAVVDRHALGENRSVHRDGQNRFTRHRERHRINGMRVHHRHHVRPRPVNAGVNLRLRRLLALAFQLIRIEVHDHNIIGRHNPA
jgi:hypothetical protein